MPRCLTRSLLHVVVVVVALLASSALYTPSADAMTHHKRERLLHVAASKKGAPYRYGADGPRRFDCSGYTKWVFARVGPHRPDRRRHHPGVVLTGHGLLFHHEPHGQHLPSTVSPRRPRR